MPMVYCQLFSGEKLLTDHLLVSIEREARPNKGMHGAVHLEFLKTISKRSGQNKPCVWSSPRRSLDA